MFLWKSVTACKLAPRAGTFQRQINMRMMSSLPNQFAEAQKRLKTLSNSPDNSTKLQIYSLFKQSTVGPVNSKRPGMLDMVGRAKWDAWNALGSITKEDAMKKYVDIVSELAQSEGAALTEPQEVVGSDSGAEKYAGLQVEKKDKLRIIRFNRPSKKNAIDTQTYKDLASALSVAAKDPDTSVVALTGNGDYFCSGNDLSNFTNIEGSIAEHAVNGGVLLRDFVASFIDFPKPLIGVVNGPAVGISVTLLGLFDVVYANEKATFQTPFSALGQTPEACSSLTFPKIMGSAKAGEVLYFNKKLTAHDALAAGLVAEVFPDHTFSMDVWAKLQGWSKLPVNSLVYSKKLVRDQDRTALHKVNQEECDRLVERWQSEDCMNAIMQFFANKSKL